MITRSNETVDNFDVTTIKDTDIFTFRLQYMYLKKLKELINEKDKVKLNRRFDDMFKEVCPYISNTISLSTLGYEQVSQYLTVNKELIKEMMYKELTNIAKGKYNLIVNIPHETKLFQKDPWQSHINLILNIFFVSNQDRVNYVVGGFNILTIGYVKEDKERRVFNINKISSKVTKC